jgi:hypothetical protein
MPSAHIPLPSSNNGKFMSTFKKLLAGAAAFYLLSGAAAYANELNVELNLGQPAPVFVAPAPAPVVISPAYVAAPWVEGYDPHHRRHDWRYWHDHARQDHWDHDHR